jgi:hypothetical protein
MEKGIRVKENYEEYVFDIDISLCYAKKRIRFLPVNYDLRIDGTLLIRKK